MSGLRAPGTYAGERLATDAVGCLLLASILGAGGIVWLVVHLVRLWWTHR